MPAAAEAEGEGVLTGSPEELVEKYDYLKETDRTRGKKQHWVDSAYRLGLRDVDGNRGGIVWDPEEEA